MQLSQFIRIENAILSESWQQILIIRNNGYFLFLFFGGGRTNKTLYVYTYLEISETLFSCDFFLCYDTLLVTINTYRVMCVYIPRFRISWISNFFWIYKKFFRCIKQKMFPSSPHRTERARSLDLLVQSVGDIISYRQWGYHLLLLMNHSPHRQQADRGLAWAVLQQVNMRENVIKYK